VALASGDPMLAGVGGTLVELFGEDAVAVLPAVSSVALARARLGWPAESTAVVRVVGRDAHAVLRELAPGRRVLVLSADEHTPGQVAALLAALHRQRIQLAHCADHHIGRADQATPRFGESGPAVRPDADNHNTLRFGHRC
jgi:precorrin-6B methylase 1